MKLFNKMFIMLVVLNSTHQMHGMHGQKKPAVAQEVTGSMPNDYMVVTTVIKKGESLNGATSTDETEASPDSEASESEQTTSPEKKDTGRQNIIITRSALPNKIGQSGQLVKAGLALKAPKADIDLSTPIANNVATIAGTINPKAGIAAGAAAVIVNESLRIAGQELTKYYGNDRFALPLLELIPSKYYRINKSAEDGIGSIEVTSEFKKILPEYRRLIEEYVEAAKKYNRALKNYQKAFGSWKAVDPLKYASTPTAKAKKAEAGKIYDKRLEPALIEMRKIQEKLKNLALHRIAIMAVDNKSAGNCGQRDGRWELHVFFYIGAKLTNIFKIPYCGNKNKAQEFIVRLLRNSEDAKGSFVPGGLQLAATKNPSIYFPDGTKDGKASSKLNWYDEMITQEDAGSLTQYFFPFDQLKMEEAYKEKLAQKQTEQTKESWNILQSAFEKLKEEKSQTDLASSNEGELDVEKADEKIAEAEEEQAEETEEKTEAEDAEAEEIARLSAIEIDDEDASKKTENGKEEVS